MDSPERPPVVHLSVREALEFLRIIDRETNASARRLLDYWARPEDLHPGAERMLDETLRMLWRI